jgi:hypothetical protein
MAHVPARHGFLRQLRSFGGRGIRKLLGVRVLINMQQQQIEFLYALVYDGLNHTQAFVSSMNATCGQAPLVNYKILANGIQMLGIQYWGGCGVNADVTALTLAFLNSGFFTLEQGQVVRIVGITPNSTEYLLAWILVQGVLTMCLLFYCLIRHHTQQKPSTIVPNSDRGATGKEQVLVVGEGKR